MSTSRFLHLTAALALAAALGGSPARAELTYWQHDPATAGDWFDPANWTAGVPGPSDVATIDNTGKAEVSAGAAEADQLLLGPTALGILDQTGGSMALGGALALGRDGGAGLYSLAGGLLTAEKAVVGQAGLGIFVQTGGTSRLDGGLYLAREHGSYGTYDLAGAGVLEAAAVYLGGEVGASPAGAVGQFTQTGGTHTVAGSLVVAAARDSVGTYQLEGGVLSAAVETVGRDGTGSFTQTGGTNRVDRLEVGFRGSYALGGGTLRIGSGADIWGSLTFEAGAWTLDVAGGLANLAAATIADAGAASFLSSPDTLTVFPSGFDPAGAFGSYAPSGLVMTAGSTLAIPAGEGFTGWGTVPGHLACAGRITGVGALHVVGGLAVAPGGSADLGAAGTLTVDNLVSGISGGQVACSGLSVGGSSAGRFAHSGGTAVVSGTVHVGAGAGVAGTYELTGGTLTAGAVRVGSLGTGEFVLDGGTLNAPVLHVANGRFWSTDSLTYDGALTVAGGTMEVSGTLALDAAGAGTTGTLSAGQLLTQSVTVGWDGSGRFVQTGGMNAASSRLIVGEEAGSHGTYEMRGGRLWARTSLYVGYEGEGVFRHLAGQVSTDPDFQHGGIYVGRGAGSSGTYDLCGPGQVTSRYIVVGGEGSGLFRQSAGSVDVGYRLLIGSGYSTAAGRYELSGGTVSAEEMILGRRGSARFVQTGGTCSIGILRMQDAGRYELGGGTFVLRRGSEITGQFAFAGGGLIRHTGGVLDLTRGTCTGDPSSTSYVGSGLALLIHPPGFEFDSLSTTALTHVPGQTLVVPPGKGFGGPARIYGHVHNEGEIRLWDLSDSDEEVGIFGGLFNTNGGYIHSYGEYEIENEISGIDSGYVRIGDTWIGRHGTGRFTQSGGEFHLISDLTLGCAAGARGTYVMTGGKCRPATYLVVGDSGTGSFQHTGGVVETYSLIVGQESGSEGTYELGGDGYLDGDYQDVGWNGRGRMVQTGGTNHARGLYLGVRPGSEGTYELHGGTLANGGLYVGIRGPGRFIQTGGTYSGDPVLGAGSYGTGTYELHGGTLSGSVRVGEESAGEFLQTGGTVNGSVRVGGETNANGTYRLQGGTINASSISIGSSDYGSATGRFIQTGGVVEVAQRVTLGYRGASNQSLLSLSGGGLSTPELLVGVDGSGSLLEIAGPAASITVSASLNFYSGAELSAAPGSTIHMTGAAFQNESTSPENLAGLKNLTLIFKGGGADVDSFEVAGRDGGASWEAFHNNFTLGTLQLGGADTGNVQLVDSFDNQPDWAGAEALYVRTISVGAGSTLDLGGLRLYCLRLENSGVVTGGAVTQVPGIEAVSATVLDGSFTPTGGASGLGVLQVGDQADIVIESAAGQTTYPAGRFEMTASLADDRSDGGLASAVFDDGSLTVQNAAAEDLLAGELRWLELDETADGSGLLAGAGVVEITGGLLAEAFGQAWGRFVQISFQLDPADIDDFSAGFAGLSNVTLVPVPEPATLALLALGGPCLLWRRR